uniref:LIM and SH3 domain protein 1-like n=1 Tax=Styela clava TaxID=7725 RepID=UPI001939D0F1|nr:LIM and SH3 domain protein 1-like [Styela clava]
MPETEEEKQKRWAKSRAMAYMTPAMVHAMEMSKYQSQNKYKEQFNRTKGKGYTAVSSTPELEHVKKQSIRLSQSKYKSEFEKNKSKFTSVADDPETLRIKKVTNQVSKVAYSGRGTAMAESKRRGRPAGKQEEAPTKPDPEPVAEEVQEPSNGISHEEEKDNDAEDTKENGDSHSYEQEHDSYSNGQDHKEAEEEVQNETSGEQEHEYSPTENGTNVHPEEVVEEEQHGEQQEYGYENTETQENTGQEYVEGEDDAEFKSYDEEGGNLDDFYANLG